MELRSIRGGGLRQVKPAAIERVHTFGRDCPSLKVFTGDVKGQTTYSVF